jgi:hypothetical protein
VRLRAAYRVGRGRVSANTRPDLTRPSSTLGADAIRPFPRIQHLRTNFGWMLQRDPKVSTLLAVAHSGQFDLLTREHCQANAVTA